MPGFSDTAVIALIALLLFGPKKLPVLARQLGKLMAEFRRASNEFRSQMEEELRIAEQADRQKEVAALESASANKISPPAEPDLAPHTPSPATEFTSPEESDRVEQPAMESAPEVASVAEPTPVAPTAPIATSGELNIMPPETGLPLARGNGAASNGSTPDEPHQPTTHSSARETELETESLHG